MLQALGGPSLTRGPRPYRLFVGPLVTPVAGWDVPDATYDRGERMRGALQAALGGDWRPGSQGPADLRAGEATHG